MIVQRPSFVMALAVSLAWGAAPAAFLQAADARAVVKAYVEQIDKGEAVDPDPVYRLPSRAAFDELTKYMVSGSDKVRFDCATMAWVIARRSADPGLRKKTVEALLQFAAREKEVSSGNYVLEKLSGSAPSDFTDKAKAQIRELVRYQDPSKTQFGTARPGRPAFLLAGAANIASVKEDLRKWAREDTWDGAAAELALARMGDAAAARRCVEKVEAVKDIVQRVRRFEDLAYTHHETCARLLTRYLMSDERLPGTKRAEDGTKVASYTLDVLARYVEGFPILSEGPSYTEAQIAAARKWVKEQKSLTFKP